MHDLSVSLRGFAQKHRTFGVGVSVVWLSMVQVTGCSRSNQPVPFRRLADPQVAEFHRLGAPFVHLSQTSVFGPPGTIDATATGGDRVWASGTLTIPRGGCLRGVEVVFKCEERSISTALVLHVVDDATGGTELPGFPAPMHADGRHTMPTSREVVAEKLRWYMESDPSSGPLPARVPECSLALWPLIADTVAMPAGFDSVEVMRETRPSLVFTPQTISRSTLSQGSWQLDTGVAALAPGCRVDVLVVSPACTTLIATLSAREQAWHDTTLSLANVANPDALLLVARGSAGAENGCLVLGDPLLRQVRERRRKGPNVLLVSLDTVREDHFRPWARGAPEGLHRLARSFVVLRNAKANSPVTDTSHQTLFSGLIVPRHTFWRESPTKMRAGIEPMAAILAARGYRCGGFTDGGLVSASRGFSEGFDRYWEYQGSPMNKTHLPEILQQARHWIAREDLAGPSFTFVHTYQAHAPYTNHEVPNEPPVRISVVSRMPEDTPLRVQTSLGVMAYDDSTILGIASNCYRSETSCLEDHVARFLEDLEADGTLDRTLVVLLSDHGEGFAEHGLLGHNNSIYDELLWVPLMIRFPGGRYGGTSVRAPVQLADVLPTVLDFLGIRSTARYDGISLMKAIRYGVSVASRPIVSIQEWQCSVLRWPYKLVIGRDFIPGRVFDLKRDPHEAHDILETVDRKVVRDLKGAFVEALVESDVGWAALISRPMGSAPPLELAARDMGRWSIFCTARGDIVTRVDRTLSLRLAPSQIGDLLVLAPRLEDVRLRVAGGDVIRHEPGSTTTVGPYVFRSVRCKGLDTPPLAPPGKERVDLQTQLRELGYVE